MQGRDGGTWGLLLSHPMELYSLTLSSTIEFYKIPNFLTWEPVTVVETCFLVAEKAAIWPSYSTDIPEGKLTISFPMLS